MQRKIVSGIVLTLLLMSILTFSIPQAKAGTTVTPKVSVEPMNNVFRTDTTSNGDTFTVNISISDWEYPGLFSYQLELHFDTECLNAASAGIPDGHFLTPTSGVPPGIFIVLPGVIDNTQGARCNPLSCVRGSL